MIGSTYGLQALTTDEIAGVASVALLAGGVLVALSMLGLLMQGRRRAGPALLLGVVGVVLTLATIAATRRLEASAQAWILLACLTVAAEAWLLRSMLARRPASRHGENAAAERDA